MSRILIFSITVLIMVAQAIATGCSRIAVDPRLALADSLISTRPDSALAVIDGINCDDMPEGERRQYDFLKIKAADNTYKKYVSEFLVRDAQASPAGEYGELFTLWRKLFFQTDFSKLTEIDFRNFLERIESDKNVSDSVKAGIMRQAALLSLSFGKYDDADRYLSSAIETERRSGDSLKMIADLQLSGAIQLRNDNFDVAEKRIDTALRLSNEVKSDMLSAKSIVYLAAVKYCRDSIDKALILIQKVPETGVESLNNKPRRQSAAIDRNGGILDSALNVVKELLYPPAYASGEIDNTINPETLHDYAFLPENFHVRDLLYLAIIRKASYDRMLEQEAKITAENRNIRLSLAVSAVIVAALILVVIIIYLKYRHRCTVIELMRALESLEAIQQTLEIDAEIPVYPADEEKSVDEMRIELRDRLLDLYNHSDGIPVSPRILNSPVHDRLMKYIEEKKEIKHDDNMWHDIETMVLEASPLFKKNLLVLLRGHLVSYDLPTALLIKAGVTPSQMAFLLNREKGTISSRRQSLCLRIFDQKLGTKIIDGIIRLL